MSHFSFKNVAVKGITACVPSNIIDNKDFSPILSEKEARQVIMATGIKERRFCDETTCASDLCAVAADKLLKDMKVPRESIDLLIFMTQTPDYASIPATSSILQNRLGLPKTTAAFDIVQGCAGFVYALSTALSYAASCGSRVLLLVGDTLSKVVSPSDRNTGLLFGDAGTAALIDYDPTVAESYFSLNSDGAGEGAIKIEDGGYRNPTTETSREMIEYPDGSRRSNHQMRMDGMSVFDFTMREVTDDVEKLLVHAEENLSNIDALVFHQSNRMMIKAFARKLKLSFDKVPISLDRFGNTSAASIPLTLVSEFGNDTVVNKKLVMSGYGAGLSWGSCLLNLQECYIGRVIEFNGI